MSRLGIACVSVTLLTTLAGCRLEGTPDLPATPVRPTSPVSTASATPVPSSTEITPAAPSSVLATPPPAPDEEPVLRALYGDQLRGSTEAGWSVGSKTRPWVGPIAAGSFTAPGVVENVALVGGLSSGTADTTSDEVYLDIRWVVLRYEGTAAPPSDHSEDWRVVGRSPSLGFNLDRSATPWQVLALTDFDEDGKQELLAVSGSVRQDLHSEVTHLFRWDDEVLAQVWSAPTYEDDTGAASAPVYYTYGAQVILEETDGVPELVLIGSTRYYDTDEQGRADTGTVLGSETIHRRFRWDGTRFNEIGAAGPTTPFAFTDADGLWLWEDGEIRHLDERRVDDVAWSPDGLRLAYEVWWPTEEQGIWFYDVQADSRTLLVTTDAAAYTLQWSANGSTLAYPLAYPTEIRLYDLSSQAEVGLPADAEKLSWAPDGQRLVYAERGSLVRYDLATQRAESLVSAPQDTDRTGPGAYRPAWSPRGDLIACISVSADAERPALVPADLPDPIRATALADRTVEIAASRIETRWSPRGDRIAVLATDPRLLTQPSGLYVVEVPPGWAGDPPLEPRELIRLDDPTHPISLPAWSADGGRLAALVGAEVWVWDAGTGIGQRWHTFPVAFDRISVHWAPSSGFLARQGEQIYWFAADAPQEPILLLQRNGLDRVAFAGR